MVYLTKKDIIGGGRGGYLIERKENVMENLTDTDNRQEDTINISNGVSERYYNLTCRTGDDEIDELLAYFKNSDPYYKTKTFPRIVKLIRAEDDLGVLSRWFRSASKARSIAEFEANM